MIETKLEEHDNERLVGDSKNKALSLKLRGQGRQGQLGSMTTQQRREGNNNVFGSFNYGEEEPSDYDKLKKEVEGMRTDMVSELKELKNSSRQMVDS
jgi:hypothetical protein